MSKLANRIDQGNTRTRKLITFLKFASNLPGLGFLGPYSDKLNLAAQKLDGVRGTALAQLDDVGDARDAWDDFKKK